MSSFLLSALFAMAKLDLTYQVAYGESASEIEVVEYYSLSCPKCLQMFNEDFGALKEKYPEIRLVFHPDPADLLTLQFMVCLEKLEPDLRPIFFETVLECIYENEGRAGLAILQSAMEALKVPVPDLGKMEFLEKAPAYSAALRFLIQEDVISTVPSYEINGVLFDAAPTFASIDKEMQQRKKQ